MNLSLAELRDVVAELSEKLPGAHLQELRQPRTEALFLGFRQPGESLALLVETAPRLARLHLVSVRPGTLEPPPAFLARCRAELSGARLVGVAMPWEDRVVMLRFQRQKEVRLLIFEGTGHHANLFLTDAGQVILQVMQASASRQRELVPGESYRPPLSNPGGPPAGPRRTGCGGSPSGALEAHFATLEQGVAEEALQGAIKRVLKPHVKRLSRALGKVEADGRKAADRAAEERLGLLLQSRLFEVRRGMTELTTVDFYDPEQKSATIVLRPDWSPQQNLEALFARVRKGKRGMAAAAMRADELRAQHALAEALLERADQVADEAAAEALRAEVAAAFPRLRRALAAAPTASRRPTAVPRRPYREFTSTTGRRILVGRGGRDNHELTFKVAGPHDVWLHARGFAGSHVVVPLARQQEPDRRTLLDAALLAWHFSKAPDAGFCEVMWTRRKLVKAIKKGAPGKVTVQGDANIEFDFDEERLKRLLATRDE